GIKTPALHSRPHFSFLSLTLILSVSYLTITCLFRFCLAVSVQPLAGLQRLTVKLSKKNQHYYVIKDKSWNYAVRIEVSKLLNKDFDLLRWYLKQLECANKELKQMLKGPVEYEFLSCLFKEPETDFEHELDQLVEYSDAYLHL